MSHITVAVRVRPNISGEQATGPSNAVEVSDGAIVVHPKYEDAKVFGFDFAYSWDPRSADYGTQEVIYRDIGAEILGNALEGYNGCLFAYGQTGSGKTHTMMGVEGDYGIIPRLSEDLFSRIASKSSSSKTRVWVSYLEIYNEKVRDLLSTGNQARADQQNLNVYEHQTLGVVTPDARMESVSAYTDIKRLIILGNERRVVAATAANARSSRSHAIFTLHIETDTCISKVNLVDLAGSERLSKTGLPDASSPQETNMINQSLTNLGIVIKALSEQKEFIPFRNSKLTFLLKDSLSGNSRTSMIATISPCLADVEETISTLRFASNVKKVVTNPKVNYGSQDDIVKTLKMEIESLKAQLVHASSPRGDPKVELEKQIIDFSGPYLQRVSGSVFSAVSAVPIITGGKLVVGGVNGTAGSQLVLSGVDSPACTLVIENGAIFLDSLTDNVFVNGKVILSNTRVLLKIADLIQVGPHILRVLVTVPESTIAKFASIATKYDSYKKIHPAVVICLLPSVEPSRWDQVLEKINRLCEAGDGMALVIPIGSGMDCVDIMPTGEKIGNVRNRLAGLLTQLDRLAEDNLEMARLLA